MFLDLMPLACTLILTPGVNSILLVASGATFGIWRSLPHMFGSVSAFLAILAGTSTGLTGFITSQNNAQMIISFVGGAFIVVLGARLIMAPPLDLDTSGAAEPLTAFQAIGLMLLNPGAYLLAVTAIAIAASSDVTPAMQVVTLLVVFTLAGGVAAFGWTCAGIILRRLSGNSKPSRTLNLFLGTSIILSGLSLILQ